MTFDKALALAYVCERYHTGQWSRGYRILSHLFNYYRLERNDSACKLLPKEEYYKSRNLAAHYLNLMRLGRLKNL